MLDHARAVDEVELAVSERQALGGVGLHERAGVGGLGGDVHAGDVERGLERAQAERAAAEVEHARTGGQDREEGLVAPAPRPCGERAARRASGPRAVA